MAIQTEIPQPAKREKVERVTTVIISGIHGLASSMEIVLGPLVDPIQEKLEARWGVDKLDQPQNPQA